MALNSAEIFAALPPLRDMEAVALFQELGYGFTDAGDGWCEITLTASAKTHNLYGIVHGGVWLLVADSAMGGALGTVQAEPGVTLNGAQLEFCGTWANQTEVAVPGIHFIQEDSAARDRRGDSRLVQRNLRPHLRGQHE